MRDCTVSHPELYEGPKPWERQPKGIITVHGEVQAVLMSEAVCWRHCADWGKNDMIKQPLTIMSFRCHWKAKHSQQYNIP